MGSHATSEKKPTGLRMAWTRRSLEGRSGTSSSQLVHPTPNTSEGTYYQKEPVWGKKLNKKQSRNDDQKWDFPWCAQDAFMHQNNQNPILSRNRRTEFQTPLSLAPRPRRRGKIRPTENRLPTRPPPGLLVGPCPCLCRPYRLFALPSPWRFSTGAGAGWGAVRRPGGVEKAKSLCCVVVVDFLFGAKSTPNTNLFRSAQHVGESDEEHASYMHHLHHLKTISSLYLHVRLHESSIIFSFSHVSLGAWTRTPNSLDEQHAVPGPPPGPFRILGDDPETRFSDPEMETTRLTLPRANMESAIGFLQKPGFKRIERILSLLCH